MAKIVAENLTGALCNMFSMLIYVFYIVIFVRIIGKVASVIIADPPEEIYIPVTKETIERLDERIRELEEEYRKIARELGIPEHMIDKSLEWCKGWAQRVTKVYGPVRDVVWRLNYIGALESDMPLQWVRGIYEKFIGEMRIARRIAEYLTRKAIPRPTPVPVTVPAR